MSQNYNQRLIEKQNSIYARERGDIEVLKVQIKLATDKIEETERIINGRISKVSEFRRENAQAAGKLEDLQKQIKLVQNQIGEKSEQIENHRILFETKSAELEDVKVKLPQTRNQLEFVISQEQKRIFDRIQQLYREHNFSEDDIQDFQKMISKKWEKVENETPSKTTKENKYEYFIELAENMVNYHQEFEKYNQNVEKIKNSENSTTLRILYGPDSTLRGIPSCSQAENIFIPSCYHLPGRMQSTPMKPLNGQTNSQVENGQSHFSLGEPNITTILEDFEFGQTPVARIDLTENFGNSESTGKTVKFEQMDIPETIPEMEPEVEEHQDFDDDLGTQFFATIDLTKHDSDEENENQENFKCEFDADRLNPNSQQFTQMPLFEQSQSSQSSQTLQQSLSEATNRFASMKQFFSQLTK